MEDLTATVFGRTPPDNPQPEGFANHRVRALKSLALLLLHEVEQLENSTPRKEELFNDDLSLSEEVQNYEVELIRAALSRVKGNQREAARILGTKVTTLNVKIKRYGILSHHLPDFSRAEEF